MLETFPHGAFLIDIKGGTATEAALLGERIAGLQSGRTGRLYVYGRPGSVASVVEAAPEVTPVSRPRLKACLVRYAALGWSTHVPAACRDTLLTIPANVAPWLWGWPERFLQRMEQSGTRVVLLGDYGGEGFSTPIDDPALLDTLSSGYDGGIWTDRIDLIAPALGYEPQDPGAILR